MPKPHEFTHAEYVQRIPRLFVEHAQAVWDEFKVPVTRRSITQAFSSRAARRGITCTDLTKLLYECAELHRIRHPKGGDYFLPIKVWNELTEEQRSILLRRVFNRTIYKENTELGRPGLAADGERSVQYFIPSPMQAFLKK